MQRNFGCKVVQFSYPKGVYYAHKHLFTDGVNGKYPVAVLPQLRIKKIKVSASTANEIFSVGNPFIFPFQ